MKKRKNRFRPGLWLIILLFMVTVSVLFVFTGKNLPMQRTQTEENTESTEKTNSGIFGELVGDIKNSVDVYGDFFNVVVKGEESKYESGYDAMAGRGKNTSQPENTESHEAKSEPITLGSADSEKTEPQLVEATVIGVVDGDTLTVSIGDVECKIRLIGIDTPESVHSDPSRNTVWGTYASDNTKTIMNNIQTVYLEYDKEPTDKYGRTLAYVWLVNDTSDLMYMLNARILADGYAVDKVFLPNNKYAEDFAKLRTDAENSNTGLWAEEGFRKLWVEESE